MSVQRVDCIVIGGGIGGISAAARIAEANRSVVVFEAESQIGYHASGRSAAILIHSYGNAVIRELTAHAVDLLHRPGAPLDAKLPEGQSGFLSPRGLIYHCAEGEQARFSEILADNPTLQSISAREAVEYCPLLEESKIVDAAMEPEAADIDADLLLQCYAHLLKENGGRIVTDMRIMEMAGPDRTGEWRIDTDSESYRAPLIVNAAGAWADDVARACGVAAIGHVPMKRSAALLPPPIENTDAMPMVISATEQWYLKPLPGKLMVCASEEEASEPHDAWADDLVIAEGLHRYEQAARYPVTHVDYTWAGLRTFVADRSPLVGFDLRQPQFFWLTAQGGYGIQIAPTLAQLATDLICGATPLLPASLINAISPQRLVG